jgi:hypothetical protein
MIRSTPITGKLVCSVSNAAGRDAGPTVTLVEPASVPVTGCRNRFHQIKPTLDDHLRKVTVA